MVHSRLAQTLVMTAAAPLVWRRSWRKQLGERFKTTHRAGGVVGKRNWKRRWTNVTEEDL